MPPRKPKTWTDEARDAITTRLRGRVTIAAYQRLAVQKLNVYKRKPEDGATGLDDGLAAILLDQVEALELVCRAVRGELFDRAALEELTMREAWRLKRTDILAGTFDHLTMGSGDPS